MGFRVRRSIKIMPGVRMTVTKTGIGVSAGVRGARVSVNSHGRLTQSVGLPGTGLGYVKTSSLKSKQRTSSSRNQQPVRSNAAYSPTQSGPAKPTLFAPAFEKAFYKFLNGKITLGDLMVVENLTSIQSQEILFVEAIRVAMPANDNARTLEILKELVASGFSPEDDELVSKYLPPALVRVPITDVIAVDLPLYELSTLQLILIELEQSIGNIDAAIEVAENVEPSTISAVSLAELYILQNKWDEVVSLTEEVSNEDDASVYLLVQRGIAFREQKYFDAAKESFKEALRIRSRSSELRQLALIQRGNTFLLEGKKALARKDFEKVLSEDANHPGIKELIAQTI